MNQPAVMIPSNSRLVSLFRRFSRGASAMGNLVGASVLVGWLLDIPHRLASHYSMLFFVALAAILAGNPPADAGSASSALGVTARVVRSCRISTTLPPPGNADSIVASTNVDATAAASIAVVCARAAAPAITISTGSRRAGIAVAQAMSMIDSDVKNKTHKESATIQIWQGLNGEALALGSFGSGWTGSIPAYRHAAAAQSDPRRAVVEINF